MGFQADVTRWVTKTKASNEKVVEKLCVQLSSSIIMRTPVDTGRARGNWEASIGTMITRANNKMDTSGQSAISAAKAIAAGAYGKTFYLVNNLPYIKRLEEGYSGQAPAGMVAVTVAAFKDIVRKIL